VYVEAVRRIAEMDLCPGEGTGGPMPREGSRGAASGLQRRSETGWLPPGFDKTRTECSDKLKFFGLAKSLPHPLSSFDVDLEEDVIAAVEKSRDWARASARGASGGWRSWGCWRSASGPCRWS
jgi:hypothetical protein